MEEIATLNNTEVLAELSQVNRSDNRFMVANTQAIPYQLLKEKCTIPVFSKDNESTISHQEFVDVVGEASLRAFPNERILDPAIRVSHPIKGRVPSAVSKPANELEEWEKSLYFERMAFLIEVPSIAETMNGNKLSLSVGGVRAYNFENLYGKKTEEKFRVFIGFKNWVCINLCISTDGFKEDLRVRTISELCSQVYHLFNMFNFRNQLDAMANLVDYSLSERQFAYLIGRLRMYPYLKPLDKYQIPALSLGDSQVNSVIRDYYSSKSFCRDAFNVFWESWNKDTIEHHEVFKILLLNNKNVVLGIAEISKGGTSSKIIDPRIIFQYALKAHASAIIVGHNHPSNNTEPSEADVAITKKLIEAGKVLDIKVLDHLVICSDGTYFSMADEGKI
jgi:hypothetical protein